MLPTLFILFAPPAIGFIAWVRLNGGALDSLGRILYYFSLFMFFLVILQIPRLIKIRFFLSWWAYSFPLAAIALASFLAYELTQLTLIKVIFLSQFTMLLVIIVLLSVLTLLEIKKGSVCVEE
jgi:tellurite resistance protein